jgi:GNAT superfamily N-acetyltransferase
MINIEINRPELKDIELINDFFQIVIRDTFAINSLTDLVDLMEEEIAYKRKCLNLDLESDGKDMYFLIAKEEDKIVGSIEYGPSNELIRTCTKGKLTNIVEIGTLYVHPAYQRKGIGSRMLELLCRELKGRGIEEFCLDSGYKSAQKVWTNKFGKPEYHLKDYWAEGSDHMIWRVKI